MANDCFKDSPFYEFRKRMGREIRMQIPLHSVSQRKNLTFLFTCGAYKWGMERLGKGRRGSWLLVLSLDLYYIIYKCIIHVCIYVYVCIFGFWPIPSSAQVLLVALTSSKTCAKRCQIYNPGSCV